MSTKNTESELLSTVQALDPSSPWGSIRGIFDRVDICESAIAEAKTQYPEYKKAIWNSFLLLKPSELLHEAPESVYRAHCAELLDRVCENQDTTLGTKAEIMMGLAMTSERSPLTHAGTVLYARLFSEILPDAPILYDLKALGTMAYDSEIEQLLAELAQKCKVPDRKPKEVAEWHTPPVL